MERLSSYYAAPLQQLFSRYSLHLKQVPANTDIRGSFWGDEEAGLVGNTLYARPDTPIHSCLHEGCHFICMDGQRRRTLDTNAGGSHDEENAVCYLQILLADQPGLPGQSAMLRDMDAWGYSFRLGSAAAWFENDAEDARDWLYQHKIIDSQNKPTFQLRQ